MATTKKTHTTKKASTTKRKAVAKKPPRLTWRFYVVAIGIFVISVCTVIVISLWTANAITKHNNYIRYDRLIGLYGSLNIGEDYYTTNENVFGDKRPYAWDKSRTSSSEVEYTHGDTVSNTVADLDAKIKAAGFTFIDEPYAGSSYVQYHYKSANGEYLRLTVESKPRQEAYQNADIMGKDPVAAANAVDKNTGPSNVVIKINLDDNNE